MKHVPLTCWRFMQPRRKHCLIRICGCLRSRCLYCTVSSFNEVYLLISWALESKDGHSYNYLDITYSRISSIALIEWWSEIMYLGLTVCRIECVKIKSA